MLRRTDTLRVYSEIGGKRLSDAIRMVENLTVPYDRRYGMKKRAGGAWSPVGAVREVEFSEDKAAALLSCQNAWVELRWLSHNMLRVRMRRKDRHFEPSESLAVYKQDWPLVLPEPRIENGEQVLEWRTSALTCRVNKRAFRLRLEQPDGRVICSERGGIEWQEDGPLRLSMALQADETCHGLGMRAARLSLRGKRFRLWNADPGLYVRDSDPLYHSIPFYLGVRDAFAYGIFWDNPSRGLVDLGATNPDELIFEAEAGELEYTVFAGGDVADILGHYTQLTGRADVPPLWALGYHHAVWEGGSAATALKIAGELRQRHIPCDVLLLNLEPEVLRDEAKLTSAVHELHDQGFRVLAALTPAVEIEQAGPDTQNVFLKYPDGMSAVGATLQGISHFPDFSSAAGRFWWEQRLRPLTDVGIDGFAIEMAEPTVFAAGGRPTSLADYIQHDNGGRPGDHVTHHNLYPMMMAQATMEVLAPQRPGKRPVILGRSGYAGSQRMMMTWTGANTSDWDHLRLTIPMLLNLSLSGVPLVGADIGGYYQDADGELYTRWLQAACLLPLCRADSYSGSAPKSPWAFGQPYEVINRLSLQLRYRLLPYLYTLAAQHQEYGWPILRPVFTAERANAALRTVDDCYLLGDGLLVAPVLEKNALKRSLYLPAGLWFDFWSNEPIWGGRVIEVPAPLERLPLFVRAGMVLPEWPETQYVGEKPIDRLTLRVYPGEAENSLYEDTGDGADAARGEYRWVYTTCEWEDELRFVIRRRTAGRFTPLYKTVKVEIVGFDEEPYEVRMDRQKAPLWFYDEGLLELTVDDTFQRIEVVRNAQPTDKTIARRPR